MRFLAEEAAERFGHGMTRRKCVSLRRTHSTNREHEVEPTEDSFSEQKQE
jgi:hypothetical protein